MEILNWRNKASKYDPKMHQKNLLNTLSLRINSCLVEANKGEGKSKGKTNAIIARVSSAAMKRDFKDAIAPEISLAVSR